MSYIILIKDTLDTKLFCIEEPHQGQTIRAIVFQLIEDKFGRYPTCY